MALKSELGKERSSVSSLEQLLSANRESEFKMKLEKQELDKEISNMKSNLQRTQGDL